MAPVPVEETYTAREIHRGDAAGLAGLFEAAGSACHCRYWHFEGDKNEWLDRCANAPDQSRREMEAAIERASDEARGIVATAAEGEIVGWLKLAPVRSVRKAFEQRYYRGLSCFGGDREGVWLVGCVLVHPRHRRRGLARSLVRCAIQIGTERGARAIEALPRRASFDVTDEELWMGPLGVFAALGFEEVHRTPDERASGAPDPYPVLRRELRRG